MTETQPGSGRRRYRTRAEAAEIASQFESSGLTRQEFCERNNVAVKTLARYLNKHRGATRTSAAQLLAVELADDSSRGSGLAVVLRGGRRVEVSRGFDAMTLQQVVAALDRF